MILYRQCDARFPFLWEVEEQPPARWHGQGEGPVQYLATSPEAAWAELLRHEEIVEPEDLSTLRRSIWAVEVDSLPEARPKLTPAVEVGGPEQYPLCRIEAARLREAGEIGLIAISAALSDGRERSLRVEGGLQGGRSRAARTVVLFGARPDLEGWLVAIGRPPSALLPRVRSLAPRKSPKTRKTRKTQKTDDDEST